MIGAGGAGSLLTGSQLEQLLANLLYRATSWSLRQDHGKLSYLFGSFLTGVADPDPIFKYPRSKSCAL
jgi:hypothetical protein